jgi:hypothetical protein
MRSRTPGVKSGGAGVAVGEGPNVGVWDEVAVGGAGVEVGVWVGVKSGGREAVGTGVDVGGWLEVGSSGVTLGSGARVSAGREAGVTCCGEAVPVTTEAVYVGGWPLPPNPGTQPVRNTRLNARNKHIFDIA